MAALWQAGSTRPAPLPCSGHTAPNRAFFGSAQDGDRRATVARQAAGSGGPANECLGRQADRLARSYSGDQMPGIEASPSFVREPEGNRVAERFIRTLKENLLWVRSFDTIQELRAALVEFATHRA